MNYFETVERWHQLVETIKILQAEERTLREGLFQGTFPKPREGTNSVTFPDGRVIKGTYVINRTLKQERWLENYKTIGIPKEIKTKLIKISYGFDLKTYRELEDDIRKRFDTVLEIKPGLPKLELVPAKEK